MKSIRELKKERDYLLMWRQVEEKAEQNRKARLAREKRRAVRIELFHA